MGVDTYTIGGDQEMVTSLCPLSVPMITGAPNGTSKKNESDYIVESNIVIIRN